MHNRGRKDLYEGFTRYWVEHRTKGFVNQRTEEMLKETHQQEGLSDSVVLDGEARTWGTELNKGVSAEATAEVEGKDEA